MEYIKEDCKVKINRGVYYTSLKIIRLTDMKIIYENPFMPMLNSKIEAEDCAVEAADNIIGAVNNGRKTWSTSTVSQM